MNGIGVSLDVTDMLIWSLVGVLVLCGVAWFIYACSKGGQEDARGSRMTLLRLPLGISAEF